MTAKHRTGDPDVIHTSSDPAGRDALVDAYQEALDLVVYLRQAIEERPTLAKLEADRDRYFRYYFWYRCVMVGCDIVEQHQHGGGQPMREMTPEEILADQPAVPGGTTAIIGGQYRRVPKA